MRTVSNMDKCKHFRTFKVMLRVEADGGLLFITL